MFNCHVIPVAALTQKQLPSKAKPPQIRPMTLLLAFWNLKLHKSRSDGKESERKEVDTIR